MNPRPTNGRPGGREFFSLGRRSGHAGSRNPWKRYRARRRRRSRRHGEASRSAVAPLGAPPRVANHTVLDGYCYPVKR